MSESEIKAEHAFLRARQLYGDSTWVGRSSDAMLNAALIGATHVSNMDWPGDEADLARCEETLKRAPAHLRARMLPTLVRYRRHVEEGDLYCEGCDNSIGHHAIQLGLCRSCWEAAHPTESFFGYPPKVSAVRGTCAPGSEETTP